MNLSSLMENLRMIDEVALMELLEITSNDLVDAFADKIEDNEERLRQAIQD